MEDMYFEKLAQIRFIYGEEELGGVVFHSQVICSCCGAIVPLEEVKIIEVYDYWVDLTAAIIGD